MFKHLIRSTIDMNSNVSLKYATNIIQTLTLPQSHILHINKSYFSTRMKRERPPPITVVRRICLSYIYFICIDR